MPDPFTIAGAAGKAISALQYVNDFKARADAEGGASDSLISYTAPARAEPITLIDTRALQLPYLRDILSSSVSIYAGYYLQAVSLMVGVGQINVIKMLDRLNPNRNGPKLDGGYALGEALTRIENRSHLFTKESYAYGLPRLDDAFGIEAYADAVKNDPVRLDLVRTSLEAMKADAVVAEKKKEEGEKRANHFGNTPKDIEQIADVPNLAVGKMLNVEIDQGNFKGNFPVSVRLMTNSVDPTSLVHILGDGVKDSSTKERWHAYRSGAISLSDMIFAVDAIDAHRSALLHDKSGTYREIQQRRRNNGLVTLRSGIGAPKHGSVSTSIGTSSNIAVLTTQTVEELERATHIRFSNAAQRQRVFEQSYMMFMAVVDPEWESVTFYFRGIALPTEISVKDIIKSAKGQGPDIADMMKAFRLGNNPTL